MNKTPNGNRKHIGIYGKTNVGKSSLINKLVGEEVSIVSDTKGTTTDPVMKATELIPVGPVLFIDTAGIKDYTELGQLRMEKTMNILKKTDIGIYIIDAEDIDTESLNNFISMFKKYNISYILIFNKCDLLLEERKDELKKSYKEALFISTNNENDIGLVRNRIIKILEEEEEEEDISLIGDLLKYGSKVILVVKIDSESPKGRLILPQVQCIRDCLDNGIKCYVVRDTELKEALKDIGHVDLVITDSQFFKEVSEIVPLDINLTGFSMLFARQKGNINEFINAALKIPRLKIKDKILIAESCRHNVSHNDIGRFKIPKLLNNFVGGPLQYTFITGEDFPENIEEYDLVIHCGACMMNRKSMVSRINECLEKKVPITNYGVILSFLTNTLDRSKGIFTK